MSCYLEISFAHTGKETVKYAEELYPWKPEQSTVLGRPGSTKRRQTYNKDVKKNFIVVLRLTLFLHA